MRRDFRRLLCGMGVALLVAITFSSCASSRSRKLSAMLNSGKMYAVTADSTSFYRYGPQQINGPDEKLPHDTVVTLIRSSFGYSKVKLMAGGEGYVATEDIKPASATLLAALFPPEPEPERENFDMQSSEPPPLETLPAPDLPPAVEEPTPAP